MKIVYITKARLPTEKAHGYQICKMCEEFSNRGVEIELWAPERGNDIKADIFSFYGLNNNFKIKKIKSFDFFRYWRYLGKASFWLQGFSLGLKLLFTPADKEAIIYTRDPEIGWIFSLRGYRTVFEAHSWPESKTWLYKLLIKRTKIVTITRSLGELLVQAGLENNNILVVPDGVDLNEFDIDLSKETARKKLNLPLDKKIALYAGHLYDWKGAGDLAEAAGLLDNKSLVTFVGGVEADAKIFSEKNKKLIDLGKIVLYRHQPHNLIPIWLKAADVLILPNKSQDKISRYYTSPLKLFEYLASRRPIVAADLPSIREVLDENNCLFFQSDNPADLADKIKIVFNSNGLAEKIAEQAYRDAKKYTWEKRAEKIVEFIK